MPAAQAVHDVDPKADHVPTLHAKQEEEAKYWPAGQPVLHVPYEVHKLEGHPAGQ